MNLRIILSVFAEVVCALALLASCSKTHREDTVEISMIQQLSDDDIMDIKRNILCHDTVFVDVDDGGLGYISLSQTLEATSDEIDMMLYYYNAIYDCPVIADSIHKRPDRTALIKETFGSLTRFGKFEPSLAAMAGGLEENIRLYLSDRDLSRIMEKGSGMPTIGWYDFDSDTVAQDDALRLRAIGCGDEEALRQVIAQYDSLGRNLDAAMYCYHVAERFSKPAYYAVAASEMLADTAVNDRMRDAAKRLLLRGMRAGDSLCTVMLAAAAGEKTPRRIEEPNAWVVVRTEAD